MPVPRIYVVPDTESVNDLVRDRRPATRPLSAASTVVSSGAPAQVREPRQPGARRR
jgi:hypothetical protein